MFQALPHLLRSFQGELFIYQLQAQDPEGSAVVFTFLSGPQGASLSAAGLLIWKATAEPTDTHTFHFTVTDDCDTVTRAAVQVINFSHPTYLKLVCGAFWVALSSH